MQINLFSNDNYHHHRLILAFLTILIIRAKFLLLSENIHDFLDYTRAVRESVDRNTCHFWYQDKDFQCFANDIISWHVKNIPFMEKKKYMWMCYSQIVQWFQNRRFWIGRQTMYLSVGSCWRRSNRRLNKIIHVTKKTYSTETFYISNESLSSYLRLIDS